MNLLNIFKKENKELKHTQIINNEVDQYDLIGKLIKEARISRGLSIEGLSSISKIPESTIKSIESNIKGSRPKFPFLRSILLKLEECLNIKNNKLVELANEKTKTANNKNKQNYIFRKFEILNSWQGSLLYFLILLFSILVLNIYFTRINIIELETFQKSIDK